MVKKKNILITTSSFYKDSEGSAIGGGYFIYEKAKRLNEKVNVFILAPKSEMTKSKEIVSGLTIYRFKQFVFDKMGLAFGSGIVQNIKNHKFLVFTLPYFLISQLIQIIKIVKNEKIDILHANWIMPQGLVAAIYKRFFNKNINLITTIHGNFLFKLNLKFLRKLIYFVLNNSDKITVVSTELKEEVLSLLPNKEVHIMPMGINTKLFDIKESNIKLKNKFGNNFKYVLFIGRIIKEKGIIELIVAMKYVIAKDKNIKLIIIGDGDLLEVLKAYVKENKLSKNVIFRGSVNHDDLPEYFSFAELLVLPSYTEGFGLVVAEAMACGVKPIVSNLPAFEDYVSQKNGIYLNNIKPNEIAKTILENINLNACKESKQELRNEIVNKFSWEIVTNNYYKIYTQ